MEVLIILLCIIILPWIVLYIKIKKYKNLVQMEVNKGNILKEKLDEIYKDEQTILDKKKEIEEINKEKNKIYKQKQKVIDELDKKIKKLNREISDLDILKITKEVKVSLKEDISSDEIKTELSFLARDQDNLVKSGDAVSIFNTEIKQSTINSLIKEILRCFNSEVESILDKMTLTNYDSVHAKIEKSFDSINKIFSKLNIAITDKYLELKLKEAILVKNYLEKLDLEKEIRKENKARILEEEKVRRECEAKKLKLEKDRAQFEKELRKQQLYLERAKDDVEKQLYIEQITQLQSKLSETNDSIQDVENREANAKAGFVYIISNIGSFGEHVFKIGMTRRLDPQERIDELSNASVPFKFDVHAFIFSDDAPSLEAILHKHFNENRLNKINNRKEFFRVDLEEIKKVVLENFNGTVHFEDIPEAYEYRKTKEMSF